MVSIANEKAIADKIERTAREAASQVIRLFIVLSPTARRQCGANDSSESCGTNPGGYGGGGGAGNDLTRGIPAASKPAASPPRHPNPGCR